MFAPHFLASLLQECFLLFIRILFCNVLETFPPWGLNKVVRKFATNIAEQMGIQLSKVSVIDGRDVGCLDVYLVYLHADEHRVSALAYQSDLDNLHSEFGCDRLEVKLRAALSQLELP